MKLDWTDDQEYMDLWPHCNVLNNVDSITLFLADESIVSIATSVLHSQM